jgi:ornithine carbamoyltransferase
MDAARPISSIAPVPSLGGRDLLSVADLSRAELEAVLDRAAELKAEFRANGRHASPPLAGRTIAMLFEKQSLRTRVTFEAGMNQLGGHAIYLGPGDVGLGVRESVADVARNLDRWVDAITIRTYAHATAVELADEASIPVVNALTDREHPCQALADLLTLRERFGRLDGRVIAFIGDGNNVFHSLALAGATMGMEIRIAHPDGYGPDPEIVGEANLLAEENGGGVSVGGNPRVAVHGADAIYTDTWTSMGQEAEVAERRLAFRGFTVDAGLVAGATPTAIVMHCLPAHRGEEITSDVLDGPRSVVLDQAENRLHVQKAWLVEAIAGR